MRLIGPEGWRMECSEWAVATYVWWHSGHRNFHLPDDCRQCQGPTKSRTRVQLHTVVCLMLSIMVKVHEPVAAMRASTHLSTWSKGLSGMATPRTNRCRQFRATSLADVGLPGWKETKGTFCLIEVDDWSLVTNVSSALHVTWVIVIEHPSLRSACELERLMLWTTVRPTL